MLSKESSTLRFYLAVLRRRWLPMLIVLVIPIAIAVAITVTAKKQYQGSALVVINRQSLADQVTGTANPSASSSDFLNIVTTYAQTADSLEVADRVATALPSAHVTGPQLLRKSTVTAAPDADVVRFAVNDHNPARAHRLASVFAREFVSYQRHLGVSAINAALRQVDSGLVQARADQDHALVSSLSARDNQLRTLRSLQTSDNFVVNPSTHASLTSPRRGLNIGLGVLAGVVLAVLLAALLETLDTRVRTTEAVEAILGRPLLARVARPPGRNRRQPISLRDPGSGEAEAFRMLRTNLELQTLQREQTLQRDAKVIMVTSAGESDQKAATLANLAVATARSGRRVIVVDMDLRHPTQHVLFKAGKDAPGLTDVLLGDTPLDEALLPVPLAGGGSAEPAALRLLTAGRLSPEPAELVGSEQAQHLVESLRDEADIVYVGCPPVPVASDALAVSRFCDAVVVVAQIPQPRRPLEETARVLSGSPAPVAGFVATGKGSLAAVRMSGSSASYASASAARLPAGRR